MEINEESENEQEIESINDIMNMKAMEEESRRIRVELDRCKEEKEAALMQANLERKNAAIETSRIKKSTVEQLSISRFIIDCSEISVQTPSSLLLQSEPCSFYKSKTTLKGLIGITPHGAVSFVSALYTGDISDKEIMRCCGILDLLEPGDSVMADKEFDVETLLQEKGVALNILPFTEKQNQFLPEHVKDTKTIAKLRIHFERAIRRVKEFHFFNSSVPLASLGSLNQMFTVAT